MTIADSVPVDRSAQFPLARAIRAIAKWLDARQKAQAQSEALQTLLFSPEHRLRDVGITREQIAEAIETNRKVWPL